MAPDSALDGELVRLPVSERGRKRQLLLRSEDSQEFENLKSRLYGAAAEKNLSPTINESPQERPL